MSKVPTYAWNLLRGYMTDNDAISVWEQLTDYYQGDFTQPPAQKEEPKEGELDDKEIIESYKRQLNRYSVTLAHSKTVAEALESQIATLNKRISEFEKKGTGRIEWGTNRE